MAKDSIASIKSALDMERDEIKALKSERLRIEELPVPVSVVSKLVEEKVDRHVEQFERLGLNIEPGDLSLLHTPGPNGELKASVFVGFLSLLLGQDEVKRKLIERVRKTYPKETIAEDERARKIVEIDRAILKSETEEESLICEIEKLGGRINRRGDLDPRVFLELRESRSTDGERKIAFNKNKLRWINRANDQGAGVSSAIQSERFNLITQRGGLRNEVETLAPGKTRGELEAQLQDVERHLKELNEEYENLGAQNQAVNKLRESCHRLLLSFGYDTDGKKITGPREMYT